MNTTTAIAGTGLTIRPDEGTSEQLNNDRLKKTNVLGLVLAGGLSTRMGQDKSLLCLRSTNQSLVEHAQNVLSSVCNGQVIVSGNGAEQLHDVYPDCGPLAGIHAGLAYALNQRSVAGELEPAEQISAMLVTPVDMPNLTARTIMLLIEKAQNNNNLAHFTGFNLPLYVPLHKSILQYLASVLRDKKALSIYQLLKVNQGQAIPIPHTVSVDEFVNVNSPEQWHKLNACSTNT
ncbi:molybdenum cofactor guanylyltransferase [Paraglaciecola chathamensis]|uniref:Molybdopterin-guanine dinucleotide biosynthesis protein A n=1 Tax=Paraglaciecola chathamensis S18K6 TaxID=1127672 RepID=A0AAV3UYZ7_9ALTE|nr:molybdenum cofactor guanylyltransferase [Paraglaciecola chathamensis]GAC09903.1 molybdopterin-guanine dinucleotide biosynthesis protein A [Paraglaciecola chathamensis S18K6]